MLTDPPSRDGLTKQLLSLGVRAGDALVVHTAFSKLGTVAGGPEALIGALRDALGPDGTLVMPSMSDDDEVPFDPQTTPCVGMGIVAETFWRMPGVLRSDNPHAFAAIGPKAAQITAAHPLDVPHGLDSPVGRVYELDGQVLLLGVGHDANTTIHLAENMAGARYLRPKHLTVLKNGMPQRYEYRELDHCCKNFAKLDEWLDANGQQHRGIVGYAQARLMRSRDVIETAHSRFDHDKDVFLHPPGICSECDEAHAALAG